MPNLPPIILYPLIFPYVIFLCLKHRCSLSVIIKANPAFELGGLPFTPKDRILDRFIEKKKIIPYQLIPHDAQTKSKKSDDTSHLEKNRALAFDFASRVSFPLVIKPNVSHRGIEVKLVKDRQALQEHLQQQKWDYLLQEYDDAHHEFGIFYMRVPGLDNQGSIVSLTEKVIPEVTGDGKSTLHQLILKSNFINKKLLLKETADKASRVLKAGQKDLISIVAAHNRGAVFYDRRQWITAKLCKAVEKFCHIKGFHFGRLDVKVKSQSALQNGEFRVIEVNGVTSEFIHIWDPAYTFSQGIKDLLRQWQLVFQISNLNRVQEKQEAKMLKQKPAKQLSLIDFLLQYLQFFLLTKKVTGKYW